MIGGNQLGAVQLGSVQSQALSGFLYTGFETIVIDDTISREVSKTLLDVVVIDDTVSRSMTVVLDDSIHTCDNVLTLDPEEGIQVGVWIKTPKTKTIWTKPC